MGDHPVGESPIGKTTIEKNPTSAVLIENMVELVHGEAGQSEAGQRETGQSVTPNLGGEAAIRLQSVFGVGDKIVEVSSGLGGVIVRAEILSL